MNELQKIVNSWIQETGGYWTPLGMLAAVMEELGEVSRELSHLSNIKTKKPEEPLNKLEQELGDLLFSIICIANYYNISISNAVEQSLRKYQVRDKNRFK
ncbi:MAG: nucleotide pyrophosphohydrolase [Candidatus Lokiarchaeota archaeon]|nr:nucleotide pyrophosphohydrolase [Candidatus Lokiarchaeota archaeon]